MKYAINAMIHGISEKKEYSDLLSIISYINSKGTKDELVYLIAIEGDNEIENTEIFISNSVPLMRDFIDSYFDSYFYICGTVYYQDYESYEDAYKVALNMMEFKKNCYEN